jgi:hypothetical protein
VNKLESGVNEPDKLVCMALAALTSEDERDYFLRRAAGSAERLLPLLGDVAKAPSKDGVTRVSGLIHRPEGGVQEDPQLQILPSNFVRGHAAVRFFQIDGPVQAGIAKRGDVLILSRWADISASIEALLKRLVLVKFFHPPHIIDQWWPESERRAEGFYLGFLRVKEDVAALEEYDPREVDWIILVDEFNIGEMKITQKDWQRIGYPERVSELPVKEIEISRLPYTLFPGVEILGEVIGWFRPGPGVEK